MNLLPASKAKLKLVSQGGHSHTTPLVPAANVKKAPVHVYEKDHIKQLRIRQ